MTFRFIGAECEIEGAVKARKFGVRIELEEPLARELLCAPGNPMKGVPMLPEAIFARIGFSEAELARYPWPSSQLDAPANVQAKKQTALDELHRLRLRLARGEPLIPEESA